MSAMTIKTKETNPFKLQKKTKLIQALAHCVKRRDRHLAGKIALALRLEKRLRALAHFARRLVGERDRDDPRGIGALLDQVRDLGGDDARLAAAGAGQDQERSCAMANGLALGRIQGKGHRRFG